MKAWMWILIAAMAGGIGLWLYSKYRKEQKIISEAYALGAATIDTKVSAESTAKTLADFLTATAEERMTITQVQAEQLKEVVKPGLEEFGVNINQAVDVVARQAAMLDSDIGALAGRELRGIDITEQLAEEADTYRIDEVELRDMVTAQQSQYSQSYRTYCEKVRTGEYTKPWYTYQHEQLSVYKQETEALVEEFHRERERGETFQQYERRTSGTTTTRAPTLAEAIRELPVGATGYM